MPSFLDQQVESLELHEFVRIYQVVCGSSENHPNGFGEETPRGAMAEIRAIESGILHWQDRGAIAKLNAAVRMLSLQITHTLIYAFSIVSFSSLYFTVEVKEATHGSGIAYKCYILVNNRRAGHYFKH